MSATPSTTSSSSTSGSGSLSSQSVPSSMDSAATIPTQDIVDSNFSDPEPEEQEQVWGKLIPVGRGFTLVDLKKEITTFGRDTGLDVCYEQRAFRGNKNFLSLSKNHFQIIKETCSETGDYVVCVKDLSSNGTFVNGVRIGKNNKHVIENHAEITLAGSLKAYVYLNLKDLEEEQETFPQEVKEKYTVSKVLGRGFCGVVHLAYSKETNYKKVAIKIISKQRFIMSNIVKTSNRDALEEVEILKKLDHPCIVKIIDAIDTPKTLFMVLELLEGGELYNRLAKERLDEPTAKLLFYQILCAVKYFHDKGFTHRDLKPENVLCASSDRDTLVKITDFGISKFVGEHSFMKTLCGTPSYLAPEVLKGNGNLPYRKECDCWSIGVILYVCLAGYMPFQENRSSSVKQQIIAGDYSFNRVPWNNISDAAKDLIKKLLTVEPKNRLSLTGALEHPWMQDKEMIEKATKLMNPSTGRSSDANSMPAPVHEAKRKHSHSSDSDSSTATKRQKSADDTNNL